MKPVQFSQCNAVFGGDQPEYLPLHAYHVYDESGRIISCWQLSWVERLQVLFTGRVWHEVLTFYNPLQPQKLSITKPEM